jgi:hypothetical protein
MRRSYHSSLAFVDLLFNTLLCFVVFFAIALMHMNKEDSESSTGIEFEAFVMIIASWPVEFHDDIDLYIRDPRGEIVFFKNKNNELMHLDRDDLGNMGEIASDENERLPNNREIVTIRRSYPGEFIVNAHVYTKASYGPVPVNIKVIKVRKNKVISDEVLIFDYSGQERTACRFTVEKNGKISKINRLPVFIASEIMEITF